MRQFGIASFSLVVAAAAMCAGVEPARAGESSHAVHATVSGWFNTDGSSWVQVNGGIDNGYLRGEVQNGQHGIGVLEVIWNDDGSLSFSGPLPIVTNHGTLNLTVLDLTWDTGGVFGDHFTAHATVVGGSGKFEGASGSFDITGSPAGYESEFVFDLSGTIVHERP